MAKVEIVDDESELAAAATDGKPRIFVKDLDLLAEKAFNGMPLSSTIRHIPPYILTAQVGPLKISSAHHKLWLWQSAC